MTDQRGLTIDGKTHTIPEDKRCCGVPEVMLEAGFELPITSMMQIEFATGGMKVTPVLIFYKTTSKGAPSGAKDGRVPAIINFCPFCGADWRDQA